MFTSVDSFNRTIVAEIKPFLPRFSQTEQAQNHSEQIFVTKYKQQTNYLPDLHKI